VGAAGFDFKLWIAQGFGIGRIPFAPGTFGSVIGLVWFAALVALGNFWWFGLGVLAGFFVSVWLSGAGEKILKQKDPGSIVLDEITAMPLCFLPWLLIQASRSALWPASDFFLSGGRWKWTLGIFAAFRLFDVLKPWPVKQSQRLPGGWGVTVDDFLAAVYVAIGSVIVCVISAWLG
jgi:phosphatidylglycerophosphatase A